MKWIRQRVLSGELVSGTWVATGSSVVAEIAGRAGYDWLIVDMEHGVGDYGTLVGQLQAIAATPAVPLVRVVWNDPPHFKRALDVGAAGIMVPWVNSADEARQAVAAMRYPPRGIRGLARTTRANVFGYELDEYLANVDDNLLTVTQIETAAAVEAADDIATVDGVDVLFIGPADLSRSLGTTPDFDEPVFAAALKRVVAACRNHGKIPGILVGNRQMLTQSAEAGFTFIGFSTDTSMMARAMRSGAEAFDELR